MGDKIAQDQIKSRIENDKKQWFVDMINSQKVFMMILKLTYMYSKFEYSEISNEKAEKLLLPPNFTRSVFSTR